MRDTLEKEKIALEIGRMVKPLAEARSREGQATR